MWPNNTGKNLLHVVSNAVYSSTLHSSKMKCHSFILDGCDILNVMEVVYAWIQI